MEYSQGGKTAAGRYEQLVSGRSTYEREAKEKFWGLGAEVHYVSCWAPRGAPEGLQKQTRTFPGSEIREIVKIIVLLKENIGF